MLNQDVDLEQDEKGGRAPTRVQSVQRASRLLKLVAEGKTDGTGKALATAAGLAVPTAHHLLNTLVSEGLLARDDVAHYILGPAIGWISDSFHRASAVPTYLSRPLQQLADTTGETTYLAAWRNGSVELLRRAEGNLPVRVSLPASGAYHDAHARAGGKALLAFLSPELREEYLARFPLRPLTPSTIVDRRQFDAEMERIRQAGYAFDREEFVAGVSCIAVPVMTEGLLFAYALSLPTQRFEERREELARALGATARGVADVLAAHGGATNEGE